MEKTLELKKDKIIIDNSIIESAINGLNLNSFKLLMFLCAEFSMENLIDKEIAYQLEFRNADFLDSIDYTSQDKYTKLKKYLNEIRRMSVEIPIWDKGKLAGATLTGLILNAKVYQKGITTISFDKEIMPYLYTLKIESDKTIFRYNLQKQFESQFSARIYFLIYRWRNTAHKKIKYSIDELKEKIGVKGKYGDIKNFEVRVLAVAKKEINSKSDILMDYKKLALGEAVGKGRKPISHIEFSFKMKNEQQQEELLTEKQIKELLELAEKRTVGTARSTKEFFDYAFAITLEGCNNNRGFFKYIKNVLLDDNVFLGQVSMFTNPEVRAATKKKSDDIHKKLFEEQKLKTAAKKAEIEAELEARLDIERKQIDEKIEKAKRNGEMKNYGEILGRG